MIGFILSKLNLLILVTAIFAIVAYFSFWLGDQMVSQQAQQIINRFSRNAGNIIHAPNQCNITSLTIPTWIEFFGNLETGNRFFYLLEISKLENVPTASGSGTINNLIVSVIDKKRQRVIAAKALGTTSAIRLFKWSPKDDIFEETMPPGKNTVLNPQSAPLKTDTVYLVKEIYHGDSFFYVVPCSSEAHSCEANLEKLGAIIAGERSGVSACVAAGAPQP